MKRIQIAFAVAGLTLSAGALANTGNAMNTDNNAATRAGTATSDGGVVLVQRKVYVPVDAKGNPGDGMMVVERDIYMPADESGSSSSAPPTAGNASAASAPAAVFVLVPDDAAASGTSHERHWRARKLDQTARNDTHCSNIASASGSDCTTYSGTGAAAAGSTQGQSGR